MEASAGGRKRSRDDSNELGSSSPEFKRVQTDTCPDPNEPASERVNLDPVSDVPVFKQATEEEAHSSESNLAETQNDFESAEAQKLPEDILDILDDSEGMPEIQDLDSVIRSFEEEILQSSPSPSQAIFEELTSDSGESKSDLGYLLEASDDELGLPPTSSSSEDRARNEPVDPPVENAEDLVELGNIIGFEDGLHNYDAFEFGLGERVEGHNNAGDINGDFVTVDGLFDYSESSDISDFTWQPESLPAS